jgi:elongation factor G
VYIQVSLFFCHFHTRRLDSCRSAGTLKKQTALLNINQNERERVSKLLLLYASQAEEVDSLPFGSVGVVLGLKSTRTGDTLVSTYKSAGDRHSLPEIIPPPAVMSASIIPHSHSDLDPVQDALHALTRTDPSVRVDIQDGQILIHGLGALHLEIVEGRLRDEWDVRFEVGRRRVSYRESLGDGDISAASDNYVQAIAGSSFPVTVKLRVRKLQEDEQGDPIWDGSLVVDSKGRPMKSPDSYDLGDPWGHIARGMASTLSVSPHTSLPMSQIHIQILDFSYPASETSPTILAAASAAILRNILRKAGMGPLMEPYIRMKIHFPQDSFGRVVKDLTESGGEVLSFDSEANFTGDGVIAFPEDGVYIPPEWMSPSGSTSLSGSSPRTRQTLHALAPLGRMLDYSSRLRALSGGHGVFEMENGGFKEVSEERRREILQEIGKAA